MDMCFENAAIPLKHYIVYYCAFQTAPLLTIVGPVGSGKVCLDLCIDIGEELWQYKDGIAYAIQSMSACHPSMQSTLLQCLLNELEPLEGTIKINGGISYASQEPWVFTGSVRENILLGNSYQKERYDKVIKACALDKVHAWIFNVCLNIQCEVMFLLAGYRCSDRWRLNSGWWERCDPEWWAEG